MMRIWRALCATAVLFTGIVALGTQPVEATTCTKPNGFKPCVFDWGKPPVNQGNFCSAEYSGLPQGIISTVEFPWICVRGVLEGGAAWDGPLGCGEQTNCPAWQDSAQSKKALFHACSYLKRNTDGTHSWVPWPQNQTTGSWYFFGAHPNGTNFAFCNSTYGSANGRFYARPSFGPGDVFYNDSNPR